MANTRMQTAPVWNNPESESAHNSAYAVPYLESTNFDTSKQRASLDIDFGPAKGETWKCDDDVQYWKSAMVGNLYSPNKSDGYRLRANNGKQHDGLVEVGSYRSGTIQRGNCMFWPLATGASDKNGIKGFSFRLKSDFHGHGGTNSEGTDRYRHNTWLQAAGATLQGVSLTGNADYDGIQTRWGSSAICTAGDQAGSSNGKFVTLTFTNDFFAEAKRMRDAGYMPVITNFVFQLWTGVRSGINSGSSDSTLHIYDFKLHYTFGPESANATKSLLLPAWSDDPRSHHKNAVPFGWDG